MDPSGDLVHLVRLSFGNGGTERQKPADKEDLVWPARLLGYIRPENTMGNILIRNCRT